MLLWRGARIVNTGCPRIKCNILKVFVLANGALKVRNTRGEWYTTLIMKRLNASIVTVTILQSKDPIGAHSDAMIVAKYLKEVIKDESRCFRD